MNLLCKMGLHDWQFSYSVNTVVEVWVCNKCDKATLVYKDKNEKENSL